MIIEEYDEEEKKKNLTKKRVMLNLNVKGMFKK
jgi:hypothetical protein